MTIVVSIVLFFLLDNLDLGPNWRFEQIIQLVWIGYIAFISTFNLTLIQLRGRALIWTISSGSSLLLGLIATFILLFYTDLDYWARIYGIAITSFFSSFITIFYLRDEIKISTEQLKSHFQYFFRLGTPLLVTAIFSWLLINQGRFFIEQKLDLTELGIYSMAFTLASPLMLISVAISRAWVSIAYKLLKDEDAKKYISYASAFILLLALIGLLNSFVGPVIYDYILDEKYNEAFKYIPYITLIMFIVAIVMFIQPILLHHERVVYISYINIIATILSAVLIWFYINQFGLYAIIFATLVARLFILVFLLVFIKKNELLIKRA